MSTGFKGGTSSAPHRECVQCRVFGTGEMKDTCEQECSYFNLIKVKDLDKLPQPMQNFPLVHCKERDANDCWFYYSYSVNNTEKEVHVVETLECPVGAGGWRTWTGGADPGSRGSWHCLILSCAGV
ncbi:hypothetical protein AAFF_G00040140 [Aldrovandia affinis]|uniref:Integrin beta subunit tail domain-containing protein n=1 Tax=Aldrovandia affinis TaxID=143900 RepID=A0AAD7S342_9TELE|nr:hypothetical protein AAFF_G00040140 [Aldrovandia affinis]